MTQLIKSLVALALSVVVVHTVYSGYIIPAATASIQEAAISGQSTPRNIFIILKDFEQELCLILMFWGGYLMATKCIVLLNERYLFNIDFLEKIHDSEGELKDALISLEELPAEVKESPLVQTLIGSVRRFLITNDVQNTSDAIETSVESLAVKLEAGNSMIRYLIWAIPSIGFIGTVRGIGQALSMADEALAGDIAGMTNSLGVAFNSTLVALLISILMMFFLHQLQNLQDSCVVDTRDYCEKFLLNRIGN
ncbi:MAG: MotA [Cycloclasticus sp. symbiont of Poecilosclerida sp. N]|nr:MAG: MotA [Cycloclasticus sp. symbiont of Poecilosclerida sp. N]